MFDKWFFKHYYNNMKKVWQYTIITLLLILGLFCVGILYLFFIPNSSLFGISYINDNSKFVSEKYSTNNVASIELNSIYYDVNIIPSSDENISLEMVSRAFGFALTKNAKAQAQQTLDSNTLKFKISEPHGLTTTNNSFINLYIPKDSSISLKLSNQKAKTTINHENLIISQFSYTTNSGDLNISSATLLDSINLELNSSRCIIGKDVVTNNNDLQLSLSSGSFTAESTVFDDVVVNYNNNGRISIKECDVFNMNQKTAGGQLNIKKASQVSASVGDTIIAINEVTNGAVITANYSGSVKIGSLTGQSSIITKYGKIEIVKCLSSATLNSKSGNITVNEAYKTISTKSTSGKINIVFSDSADHYSASDTIKSRTLYASIHNGSLTASGVEHFGSNTLDVNQGIVVTGNGRIYIKMNDVKGSNTVSGNSGDIRLIINNESSYKLTTNPDAPAKGSVRVNLMQLADYRGYTTKSSTTTYVNCSSSTYNNSLTVSSIKGNILILDDKLI